MIEREPITVILSEKGWIRSMRGHTSEIDEKGFKAGDRLKLVVHAQTTDKLLLLSTGGKVYTLAGDRLPGGRGQGEPVRLMVDLEEGQDIVDLFVHRPGRKRVIASTKGDGFVVSEDELIANTRKGKQVLNVSGTEEARLIVPVDGDTVAIIGDNRKLLVFPLDRAARDGAAARASACRNTRMAASRTSRPSRQRPASPGPTPPAAPTPAAWPNSPNGSATAPKPAASRQRASPEQQPLHRVVA